MSDPNPAPSTLAKPGPHPHEADAGDKRHWGGEDTSLPEGVEPFRGESEGSEGAES